MYRGGRVCSYAAKEPDLRPLPPADCDRRASIDEQQSSQLGTASNREAATAAAASACNCYQWQLLPYWPGKCGCCCCCLSCKDSGHGLL